MFREDVSDDGLFVGRFTQPKPYAFWKDTVLAPPPEKQQKKCASSTTAEGSQSKRPTSIASSFANEVSLEHRVVLHGNVKSCVWLDASGEGEFTSSLVWRGC